MKTDPTDDLLRSLIDESNALPQAAAAHARARQRSRTNTLRISALLIVVSTLSLGIWFSQHSAPIQISSAIVQTKPQPDLAQTAPRNYVKVYTLDEPPQADALPDTASEREKQLIDGLPGVPRLIVKDRSGDIAYVHIFER